MRICFVLVLLCTSCVGYHPPMPTDSHETFDAAVEVDNDVEDDKTEDALSAECGRDDECQGEEVCRSGECVCPVGKAKCSGEHCRDILSSEDHCGGCGLVCEPGGVCIDGLCAVPCTGKWCINGDVCCDGRCAANDPDNCGGCGLVCPSGQSCCGEECIDTANSWDNCGACDLSCGRSEYVCMGSRCVLK